MNSKQIVFNSNLVPGFVYIFYKIIFMSGRLFTASLLISSMMCTYFSVCLIVECPANSEAVFMLAPFSIRLVTNE